jgi:hypothetical protein
MRGKAMRRSPSNLELWFSILAGPAAWAAHLSIEYFLTTAKCELSAGDVGVAVMVSTIVVFGLASAGLVVGILGLRSTPEASAHHSKEIQRRRFMATSGMILSLLFLVGLVFATIPVIFLEPCRV